MARLPTPGSDDGDWGTILNDYLSEAHEEDGTLKVVPVSQGGTGGSSADDALAALGAIPKPTVITEAGTSRILAIGDAWNYIRTTSGSSVTITVPPASDVDFDVGTHIYIWQGGEGGVSIEAGIGVTVNVSSSYAPTSNGAGSNLTLVKTGSNEWDLFGMLETGR